MCGNACYWKDESSRNYLALAEANRQIRDLETANGILENLAWEADEASLRMSEKLGNALDEIEALKLQLEDASEGYAALDDLYMQRIAEDADEDQDEAIEALISEARFRELADNAAQEAEHLTAQEKFTPLVSETIDTGFDWYLPQYPNEEAADAKLSAELDREDAGWVKLPPLPEIHTDASVGTDEVFYSGSWFVFSEWEVERLETALDEKLRDVAELTAIKNRMEGK